MVVSRKVESDLSYKSYMRVCYVVVGFHPEEKEKGYKAVNMSIPGNHVICGVTQDMATARLIASEQESVYGNGNIMIYNAELKPKKTTDIVYPGAHRPSWMR